MIAERIYVEQGTRRVFACAIDWPGWCRSARGDDAAIAALADYAGRYDAVAREAGMALTAAGAADMPFTIVERVAGTGTTDFGAPDAVPEVDRAPLDAATAARHADLVAASWTIFERIVGSAPPVLRRGPRGGGRDRDEIVRHVADAERSYARKLGVRYTPTQLAAPGGAAAMRAELLDVLRSARAGTPLADRGWPARYAARRIAWHVLDHAWEIQDKAN